MSNKQSLYWSDAPLQNRAIMTFERGHLHVLRIDLVEKEKRFVTLEEALTGLIFCCCLEVWTFHGESNFKTDEGIIPDNTGIISLNDLYFAKRHRVLFNSTIPSLAWLRLKKPIYNQRATERLAARRLCKVFQRYARDPATAVGGIWHCCLTIACPLINIPTVTEDILYISSCLWMPENFEFEGLHFGIWGQTTTIHK